MKKLYLCLLALSAALPSFAKSSATITSIPEPAVANRALKINIKTDDLGSTVYCYTWCEEVNSSKKSPEWDWTEVLTDYFKMSGSGGSYTFTIDNIQTFYGLTDGELAGLTKLGFIARTSSAQTVDCFVEVTQPVENAYSGGDGSETNPYIISTAADLKTLSETAVDWMPGLYFTQNADIDASTLQQPVGTKSSPFKGVYDGGGHSVKNLQLANVNIGESVGLFGAIDGATIKDLGVVDASISGKSWVGLLVGYAASGTIDRCFSTGTVTAGSICAGGLVGENAGAKISNCYSGATVTNANDHATGGLVGKNTGEITNVYATGEVSGYDYVGGVVGVNYGTVSSSVSINSKVTSTNDFVGRFGGNNNSLNSSTNNYSWTRIAVSRASCSSSLGYGDEATSLSSAVLGYYERFKSATGWDFETVWQWETDTESEYGRGYPVLQDLDNQENVVPAEFFSISTGIESVDADDAFIAVGPNPTVGEIRIDATDALGKCAVFNLSGALIAADDAAGASSLGLDLSDAPAGMYILHVSTAQGAKSTYKIIKK